MTAEPPAVSVVVPTRDRPALLRRAVAAVLEQTYPGPVECLVVFDQSDPDLPWERLPAGRRLALHRNQRTPAWPGPATAASWPPPASWSPSATTTTSGCPRS